MHHYLIDAHKISPSITEMNSEVNNRLIGYQPPIARLGYRLECEPTRQQQIQYQDNSIQQCNNPIHAAQYRPED